MVHRHRARRHAGLAGRVAGRQPSRPRLVGAEHPTWLLASLVGLEVVFVEVALGGSLWLGPRRLWGRGAAGALAAPIRSAWLNRNLSSGTARPSSR